ncbi:DNA polymerase III subunit beta [Buchnera aphidicola (Ceratoglyphina bambusae)]|uniref:DNA polymerase III subunit beta n=1 Tax=Buchnera aphidicola TaxID=9 RepID=UPI0031B82614
MKFIIEQKKILKILKKNNSIIVKNYNNPILENIFIKLNKKKLILISNNVETELITKTYVDHQFSSGETTISGKKLFNICKSFSEHSKILFSLKKKIMKINIETVVFKLSTLPSSEYPKFNSLKKYKKFTISQKYFKKIIQKSYFCIAKNDARHYLNGLYFIFNKKFIRAVSTDGYRMAISTILLKNVNFKNNSIIITKTGILEMLKLLKENDEKIYILINNYNLRIYTKKIIFTTKLIEGNFPNYKNLIIKKPEIILEINLKIFKKALNRISILSDSSFYGIQFHVKKNVMKIISKNEENESAKEKILIKQKHPKNIKFNLNSKYLLNILQNINSEKIHFLLNKKISIIQIKEKNNNLNIYIIMPLIF